MARLKQQSGGDLLIYGSASLVSSLIPHNLIDEYRLMVHPVVVGRGKHLVGEDVPMRTLKLTDTKTLTSGVVVLSYQPAR